MSLTSYICKLYHKKEITLFDILLLPQTIIGRITGKTGELIANTLSLSLFATVMLGCWYDLIFNPAKTLSYAKLVELYHTLPIFLVTASIIICVGFLMCHMTTKVTVMSCPLAKNNNSS